MENHCARRGLAFILQKCIFGELCNWYWKREGWREGCYWTAGLKYTATAFVFSIFPCVAASEKLMTLAMKSWMT